MRFIFSQTGDFQALYACEDALGNAGFSSGSWQRGAPCGALYGDFIISKWRGMSEAERAELHASLSGDGRNGPIILTIHPTCPPEGLAAIERVMGKENEHV